MGDSDVLQEGHACYHTSGGVAHSVSARELEQVLWGRNILNGVSHNSLFLPPFLFPGVKLKIYQGRISFEVRLFLANPVFVNLKQITDQRPQQCF